MDYRALGQTERERRNRELESRNVTAQHDDKELRFASNERRELGYVVDDYENPSERAGRYYSMEEYRKMIEEKRSKSKPDDHSDTVLRNNNERDRTDNS